MQKRPGARQSTFCLKAGSAVASIVINITRNITRVALASNVEPSNGFSRKQNINIIKSPIV